MLFRQIVSPKVGGLRACVLTAGLAVSVFFSANLTSAQTIIDGEGFEAPDYSTTFDGDGKLEGQLGELPGDGVQAKWLASTGTSSTAIVQTAVVHPSDPGGQAVRMDHAANELGGGGRFGIPVTAWPDNARYVCIEWDMWVEDAAGPSGTFGPFFGVEAYDDAFGSTGLMGSMGVDATTGDVLFQETSTGHLAETGTTVNFGEWNHFHIDLDFDLHEYSLILNGTTLHTEPFVDGSGLDNFSDAPIASFAAAGDPTSQALTGTAYFDNYIVYQLATKIPEPTTMALGLIAMVSIQGLSRRR